VPDGLDGSYRNPILSADYPDPDVIRDGHDYYMTVSSFHVVPGLPILHSRDLVNWTLINHAVRRLPPRYDAVQPGCGIWAPAIRKHAGKFWIFYAMPDEGIFCTTADHPAAPWSEPHLVAPGPGLIDPCPLWDDDGKAYLVHAYAFSRCGIKHKLHVRPMAPDASRLLGDGQIIFDDPQNHPTIEGPKFYKFNGTYYILAPAGGVETGWQLALRSRTPYGPYEHRIVLEQGTTPINGPHQGGLVDTPTGEWWFIHFQDSKPYGRIAHLQPARWQDGWPLMGIDHDTNGIGEPVLEHPKPRPVIGVTASASMAALDTAAEDGFHCEPQTSDDFNTATRHDLLSQQWHWNANPRPEWHSLSARPGWLRLFTAPGSCGIANEPLAECPAAADGTSKQPKRDLIHLPQVLLQKLPCRSFIAETGVEFHPTNSHQRAGFAIIGRQYAALVLRPDHRVPAPFQGSRLVLELVINGQVVAETELAGHSARLQIQVRDGGTCTFGYKNPGGAIEWFPHEFQAIEGVWVGAKIGLFAVHDTPSTTLEEVADNARRTGHADFNYLRFLPPAASE
jgi:beta-xylosidase